MKTKTRHLVDSELLDLLDRTPALDISPATLADIRESWRVPLMTADEIPRGSVEFSSCIVPGPVGAPDVELRIYRPAAAPAPLGCIFHIHGGGFIGGVSASLASPHRALCLGLNCVLATVSYRLAPETRFPGSIEDCYAALSWLHKSATAMGIDPQLIGVMGESAAGGLAAALALLVRDRGELSLSFQHLIYPMLDDRTGTSADAHPFAGEFGWTSLNNHFGWSALLGKERDAVDVSAYAAPARAQDLAGLPPAFISTGALDLFVEEDMDYARRLMRAGVAVELHVYAGAFHGFDCHPTAKVARAARRDSFESLSRAFTRRNSTGAGAFV